MGTVQAKGISEAETVTTLDDDSKKLNLTDIPARIDRVHVDGLRRTKDDIILETVREVFTSTNFSEVVTNANRVRGRLEALGCFKHVDIFIDTSSGREATSDGLEVTFFVKELGRVKGSLTAVGGDNEGSMVVGLQAPNLLGRGEKIQLDTSFKLSSCSNLNLSLSKPLRTASNAMLTGSLFQQRNDFPPSGYKLIERGALIDLAFNSIPQFKHNLQYEAVWREIGQLSKNVALVARKEYGHSLKSAVRHILTIDRRDTPIFPTKGGFLRLSSELAGLGGDVSYHKHEAALEAVVPLPLGVVLIGRAQAGFLQPTGNGQTADREAGGVTIADRFFLGGPTSVRGFLLRGIGPRPEGYAIGANFFWASGLHLYAPLPFRAGRSVIGELFRLHAFTTIGKCDEGLEDALKGYRASWGAGLALRIGQIAQLEVNYVLPFMFLRTDAPSPGIQFGLGVQFL